VLAGLPAPTRPGTANNFDSLPRRQDYNDKFDIKVDHQFSTSTSAWVRYSHREVDNYEPSPIPGDIGSPSNASVYVVNRQAAGAVTHTLSPNSLLDVRFSVSPGEAGKSAPGTGGPTMLDLYGITGLPTDPRFAGGTTNQNVTGWTAWGRQNSNPQFQDPFVINGRVNFTRLLGRHSLKMGYEYQSIDTEIDDFNPKYGNDSYSGQFSRPAGAVANPAIYNLADFMFGARSSYALVNPFIANLRQRMHFGYIQDDFRVNEKLTLNLGLRYEYATPQWEKDNFLTSFDPATNSLIQARDGSVADRALVNPDRNNFAPRLGLAYKLTDRTVVRSGFGVSYVHFNRLGGENLLSFNGPHVVEVAISQQPSQGLCVGNQTPTTCFRPTQNGYPEGYNVPSNYSTLNARVNYIPRDTPTGSVRSWHVTVQRELADNLLFEIAYVGNQSNNLMILGDYNQARPNGPDENLPLQARRPIQDYQFIQIAFAGGEAEYHALQTKIERRFSRGLYLLNSFTWSKAMDYASGHLETQNGDNSRVNYRDIEGEWGLSGYNQPLNNTTSVVWDLPFGRDRAYATDMHPVLEGVLGNVQRQRRADLPAQPERRSVLGRAVDHQLLRRQRGDHPDRPHAAVRQRAAQRGEVARLLSARPRAAQVVRAAGRPEAAGVQGRVLQRAEPDQLPRGQRQPVGGGVWHDRLDVSGSADPVGSQGLFLGSGHDGSIHGFVHGGRSRSSWADPVREPP
jgi:hypothetical protein